MSGPLGDTVEACYGLLPDGGAVVEMAAAAGLPLVQGREDPLNATTRGVGELLLDAAGRGARSILLGLGGSCTNDCGIGMAAALGFRFLDGAGDGGGAPGEKTWDGSRKSFHRRKTGSRPSGRPAT